MIKKILQNIGWIGIVFLAWVNLGASLVGYVFPKSKQEEIQLKFLGPEWRQNHLPLYTEHQTLAHVHILLGILLLILGIIQFSKPFQTTFPKLHRPLGYVYSALALIVCMTAFLLAAIMPFAGLHETLFIGFFTGLAIVFLGKGIAAARQKKFDDHNRFMARHFAIILGVSSFRIWHKILADRTTLSEKDLFLTAMWIGFLGNCLAIEIWLWIGNFVDRNRGKSSPRAQRAQAREKTHPLKQQE